MSSDSGELSYSVNITLKVNFNWFWSLVNSMSEHAQYEWQAMHVETKSIAWLQLWFCTKVLICSLELCSETDGSEHTVPAIECYLVWLATVTWEAIAGLPINYCFLVSLTHLQWVSHIVRFHYQHSCWQCSGSSLHLTSAHWGWWVLNCLLLETSPHHTTATLHSHLLFSVSTATGSVEVQSQ